MRSSILITFFLIALCPGQVAAQTDPRAPTDPSNPLKLLIDKLNDPQRGAALRAQWKIDRAVWVEPVTAVKNGVQVLVTAAHADLHTSIDGAGAVWSPDGPLISAPHNPTGARVLIPRGYEKQSAPTRMVSFAPGGGATEYTLEPRYAVRSPVLRRGYILCVINAWSSVAAPIPLSRWGPRFNEIVGFVQTMVPGLGLPAPTFTYGWGESRGARMLAYSSELSGTPFNGVIQERGGGDVVESALEQIHMLGELKAVNPVDGNALANYISKIGRRMNITTSNGVSRNEFIPIAVTDDERRFFELPRAASILMPIIPPYSDNPATAHGDRFRIPLRNQNASGDDSPFDSVLAWSTGPINTRRFLYDVDPEYSAEVDNGSARLRDWNLEKRPAEVRTAVARLIPTGQIRTKILKMHGTLDPNIYPSTAIKYVQQIVEQGRADQLRWYLVPGMGHVPATLEEKFTDDQGKTVSFGVQLTHLDLLINWVEKGINPGDFIAIDPGDPTKTLVVKGAHQLGLQNSPLKYFWAVCCAPQGK